MTVALLNLSPVRAFKASASFFLKRPPADDGSDSEILPARRLLEASNRLQHPIHSGGISAFGLLQIEDILPLDAFIFGVGFRHAAACLSKSQFREGEGLPIRRSDRSANWTSSPGIVAAVRARRTFRCMTVSHVPQNAFRFPDFAVRAHTRRAQERAARGSRHRKQ